MTVKNEITTNESEKLIDDISEIVVNESKNEEEINQDVMAQLKVKMANKKAKENKSKEEVFEENDMSIKIVEKKKRSLDLGIIGTGQCGSRLAESFYKLGYQAIALNTAAQDLEYIELPEENKYLLEYGIGGASKDRSIGQEAIEQHREAVNSLIATKLEDAQVFVLASSLGGGSGSGSLNTIIDILNNTGKPIICLVSLPLTTDDALSKSNSLEALSEMAKQVKEKRICNLVVLDNAKLESRLSDVGQMDFYRVANDLIVQPLDIFNHFSAMPSSVKSLDGMEMAKLLTDGEGLSIYGSLEIENYEEPVAIAEGVIEDLNHSLLAGGFNLETSKYIGCMFIGNEKVMQSIPSSSVNYAMALIKENCPNAEGIFRGIYVDDTIKNNKVKVFSMFSGLGLPSERIEQLKKEVLEENQKVKSREQARNLNLQLDTGKEATVSQADKVRDMIKKKSSSFAKNFGGGQKDFRKK